MASIVSITIVHIRKFDKIKKNTVRFRFVFQYSYKVCLLSKATSTRIRIFLKTHLFHPYKKDLPIRGAFSKLSPFTQNAVTCKFRYSITMFDIRKRRFQKDPL